MRQIVLQKAVVPPGGWRAKCPHCSYWIIAPTYPDWVEWIAKHNKANGHDFWDYETQLCQSMPPGVCSMENGAPGVGVQCEIGARELLAGGMAIASLLAEHAIGREVFVDQGEAERRAAICSRCSKNVHLSGCSGCGAMQAAKGALSHIKGDRKTSTDPWLFGCCACMCDLQTIVHIRHDILRRGVTAQQDAFLEQAAPHCWKRAEPA